MMAYNKSGQWVADPVSTDRMAAYQSPATTSAIPQAMQQPSSNPWVSFENMSLNDRNQALNVPTFSQNDFVWNANSSYDPNSRGGSMQPREVGDRTEWEWVDDGTLKQGSWGWNPETSARLKAGGWDTENYNNIIFNQQGDLTKGWRGGGIQNEDPNANWYDLVKNVTMKNSASTGLGFDYKYDQASGTMVPTYTGGSDYITNSGEANRKALAAFGGVVGAGLAIPAAAAALGGGATGSMTAAEAAALSAESAGGVTGVGAGGAEAAAASGLPTAMTEGAGSASGLVELGQGGAGYTGSIPSTVTSTSSLETPWWSQAFDWASKGNEYKGYFDKANTIYNKVTQPQGQGGKGPSILDMIGGYYSGQQMKDLSGNLKGIYSDQQAKQDVYGNMLRASYERPETFYGSNQFKGLQDIYKNQVDRQAAKGGTLANPTQREVLLQAHAMKAMEDYRNNLRQAAQVYDPRSLAEFAAKGNMFEANANTGPFATAGRGNTGSTQNTVMAAIDTAKTAKEIWDAVSKWFS